MVALIASDVENLIIVPQKVYPVFSHSSTPYVVSEVNIDD